MRIGLTKPSRKRLNRSGSQSTFAFFPPKKALEDAGSPNQPHSKQAEPSRGSIPSHPTHTHTHTHHVCFPPGPPFSLPRLPPTGSGLPNEPSHVLADQWCNFAPLLNQSGAAGAVPRRGRGMECIGQNAGGRELHTDHTIHEHRRCTYITPAHAGGLQCLSRVCMQLTTQTLQLGLRVRLLKR